MEGKNLFGELRVLIVDPSEDTSEVLRLVLEHHGCRAIVAGDLRETAQALEGFRPDLVIMDENVELGDEKDCERGGSDRKSLLRWALASGAKILVLGRLQLPDHMDGERVVHLRKPYHYRQILGTINQMTELSTG
jgi:CheY-like chemotaxis protein